MNAQLPSSQQKGSRRWLWSPLAVGRRLLRGVLVFLGKHRSVVPLRTTHHVKECQCATKGVSLMATNLALRRSFSRYALMLLSLLTLVGILSGCGVTSVGGPSHPSRSTPTSTPTLALKGTIREIPLPANLYPRDITTGPDGNLWIAGNPIGRITPTGVIREFPLPANSFAIRITTGPDGNLWFIEADKVGRITPAGTISEFPLPSSILAPNSCEPYTLCGDITTGLDHALWFTEPGTAVQNGKIWRITPAGTISAFPLPDPQSHPTGISTGSDGNLWCVGYIGNNAPKGTFWRITPTGTISKFPFTPGYYSFDITDGPDGNLWYPEADLDGFNNKIGRITPSGRISEFPVPNRLSYVNGITAGPDGNLWFTEDTDNHSQNGKIGRITLTGTISEFPLPTPRGGPVAITGGPGGTIWFIEANSHQIGHLV